MRAFFSICVILLLFGCSSSEQDSTALVEIKEWRKRQKEEFLDPNKSPLSNEEREKFKDHDYFPIDLAYRVEAKFQAVEKRTAFKMTTTAGTTQLYNKLGDLRFKLKGEELSLEAYAPARGFSLSNLKPMVFLPIKDGTNGNTTYEGGRYLYISAMPEGDIWTLDFNQLYNPYCVYNERIVCPLVPEANHLSISIEAGVRGPE